MVLNTATGKTVSVSPAEPAAESGSHEGTGRNNAPTEMPQKCVTVSRNLDKGARKAVGARSFCHLLRSSRPILRKEVLPSPPHSWKSRSSEGCMPAGRFRGSSGLSRPACCLLGHRRIATALRATRPPLGCRPPPPAGASRPAASLAPLGARTRKLAANRPQ